METYEFGTQEKCVFKWEEYDLTNPCDECDATLKPKIEWGCTSFIQREQNSVHGVVGECDSTLKPETEWKCTWIWNM